MTHKPPSAPRGRPMLRDAMSPSERSVCNHRFVVDCGKISVIAIFLAPKPRVAMRSMAKRSFVRRLENTCDLREVWLVVYGYIIKSVMCVSVQRVKNLLFVIKFTPEGIVNQNGIEICRFHPNFDHPFLYDNLLEK